jgi:predicted RNase H-like HicB family nuclease
MDQRTLKVVVERHPDGYIAYPVGLRGACIGEGDTFEEALADARSAIRAHIEEFGPDAFGDGGYR